MKTNDNLEVDEIDITIDQDTLYLEPMIKGILVSAPLKELPEALLDAMKSFITAHFRMRVLFTEDYHAKLALERLYFNIFGYELKDGVTEITKVSIEAK